MWIFENKGRSINGIPQKDLTIGEFNELAHDLQVIAQKTGIYQFVELVKEPVVQVDSKE